MKSENACGRVRAVLEYIAGELIWGRGRQAMRSVAVSDIEEIIVVRTQVMPEIPLRFYDSE